MAHTLTGWKRMSWGTIATLEYGKGLRGYQNSDGQYPVFGTNGQIGWHSECLCPSQGVIVGRKGAYRGIHYSDSPFFVIDTAFYLKPIVDGSFSTKWAYYQLLDFDINKMDSGSAIPSTSRDAFYAIQLYVPPFSTQRKIVAILSAYDDLIENNLRRIKILEEMAQNLYREWFVKFHFPGHKHARFIYSPLGRIPEGWHWEKLKNVCDSINYGFTASANKEVVGPKFLRITDIVPNIIEWESVPFCEVNPDEAEKYSLSEGDIVIARTGATTGYAKRLNKRHPKSVFASYLVRIRPNAVLGRHYTGIIVESNKYKEFIKRNLGGAAQPQANAQVLTSINILVPAIDVIHAFDDLVQPLADKKELLQIKNRSLRRTRDLLLPKLISGEVDVSELDIAVPEEVKA